MKIVLCGEVVHFSKGPLLEVSLYILHCSCLISGNGPDDLDHSVLAVGFGTLDNKDYYLVKNSWSTHWGNDGYILMSRDQNNCGVATDASYADIV